MDTAVLTLRVPQEMKDQLSKLAASTHRSQSFVGAEAIRQYLELETWQVEEIKQALKEADAGEFATDDEFNSILNKHAR